MVIWAVDPEDDDVLLVVEYWSNLEEFAAGTHSEMEARFMNETENLIVETTVLFEAEPAWVHGAHPLIAAWPRTSHVRPKK